MKKRIIILFILLSCFCFGNVDAAEYSEENCENLTFVADPNTFEDDSGILLKYWKTTDPNTTYKFDYIMYKLEGNNGDTYVAYCRNAGKCATSQCNNHTTDQIFVCSSDVFDPASDEKGKVEKIYEKGIIKILEDGYYAGKDEIDYIATNIALRTYEMLWISQNTSAYEHRLNSVMKYYTNIFLTDETIKSKLQALVDSGNVNTSDIRKSAIYVKDPVTKVQFMQNSNNIEDEIRVRTKNLVIKGLDAALEYTENEVAEIIYNENPREASSPVSEENGIKTYKLTHTYNFEIKNFESPNAEIVAEFECLDCDKYNVDYEILINGEVIEFANSIDFMQFVTDGNGNIKFDIIFTGTSEDYECEPLNYKFLINYYDDSLGSQAFVVRDKDCQNCQKFYMLYEAEKKDGSGGEPEEKGRTLKIEKTAELCTMLCEDAEKNCHPEIDPNSSACKIFREKYKSDCTACTTNINNDMCSEEDSNIDIQEGYDIDTASCSKEENIIKCIIENEDPSGHSYQATTSTFANVVDNDYCAVYCKEDYHFVLPGQKETNSGRYFSLQASISGSKTCYTSNLRKGDFEEDLKKAKEELITQYNVYIYEYYLENEDLSPWLDIETLPYISSQSCASCLTGSCCYCTVTRGSCVNVRAKKDFVYPICNFEGNCPMAGEFEESFGKVEDAPCPGTGTCYYYKDEFKKYLEENNIDYKEEAEILNEKIQNYLDILNQYNKCGGEIVYEYNMELKEAESFGWKMEYNYDPIIKFWYAESYMENVYTDKLDTIGDVTISDTLTEEFWFNDDNKIPTNEKSFLENWSPEDYVTCKVDSSAVGGYSCGKYKLKVNKSKYISQKMESAGEYITPTQFYNIFPTGSIVVGKEGMEDDIENSSELTNLLPVGLGTTQGVYNYALMVENLGEYYDSKDELGRLWGADDSVAYTVTEDENLMKCLNPNKTGALVSINDVLDKLDINNVRETAVYVCSYTVNCPDCPVECDPVCKNPDCPENECPVECDDCVYTNGESNIIYRPISPGDINPNDRVLGKNWYTGATGSSGGTGGSGGGTSTPITITDAMQLKAYTTTQEIEESGESIYDIDYDNPGNNVDTDFGVRVTLDTRMINRIKSYNDQFENSEGYANNSLKCYDYVGNDEETYDNIYCYSTFIDELIYDGFDDRITIVGGERIIGANEDDTDSLRKDATRTDYWTTWDEATWNITTQTGINYQSDYKNLGIGPSWK